MKHNATKVIPCSTKDGSISKWVVAMLTMKHHEIANIECVVLVFHALILYQLDSCVKQ